MDCCCRLVGSVEMLGKQFSLRKGVVSRHESWIAHICWGHTHLPKSTTTCAQLTTLCIPTGWVARRRLYHRQLIVGIYLSAKLHSHRSALWCATYLPANLHKHRNPHFVPVKIPTTASSVHLRGVIVEWHKLSAFELNGKCVRKKHFPEKTYGVCASDIR